MIIVIILICLVIAKFVIEIMFESKSIQQWEENNKK